MAAMKRSKEPDGDVPNSRVASMAGYNSEIDAIREEEYPMLQGEISYLLLGGVRDSSYILQDQPISTTPARRYTPNLSWTNSPKT